MYLNMKYLEGNNLSFEDVFVLQLAKQQRSEDCTDYLEGSKKSVKSLEKLGYLTRIKGKKADPEMSKIRISKEGATVLDNLEIVEVTEDDLTLFDRMKGIYLNKEKVLGNQKKTKMFIALFRVHSGINKNNLAFLMNTFVIDDRNMKFNNCLEYALFKPQNAYATKFDLEESRLYQYYLTHKDHFDKQFKSIT